MSYFNMVCDSCGREVYGCNIVNGMKFCAKCYQETFGETDKDKQIAELQKQLEEKDKEIETKNSINNLYKATVSLRDNDFKDLVYENNSLKQQLNSQPAEIVEKIKNYKGEYFEWKIGDKIYPAFKITEEDLDNILKEYQK